MLQVLAAMEPLGLEVVLTLVDVWSSATIMSGVQYVMFLETHGGKLRPE